MRWFNVAHQQGALYFTAGIAGTAVNDDVVKLSRAAGAAGSDNHFAAVTSWTLWSPYPFTFTFLHLPLCTDAQ